MFKTMYEIPSQRDTPSVIPVPLGNVIRLSPESGSLITPTQGEITAPGGYAVEQTDTPPLNIRVRILETELTEPPERPDDDGYTYMPTAQRPLKEVFETDLRDNPEALSHLAVLGLNDTIIVRYSPAEHHEEPPYSSQEADTIVRATITHHQVLADSNDTTKPSIDGIAVAATYYQPQLKPDGTAYITSITDRVEGTPFSDSHKWQNNGGVDSAQRGAAIHLAKGLIHYYDWVLQSATDRFLWDITGPDQYVIDNTNRPVLIDTDPLTASLSTATGQNMLFACIEELKLWTDDGGIQDGLTASLERLSDQFNTIDWDNRFRG